jgi:hypothetical protein
MYPKVYFFEFMLTCIFLKPPKKTPKKDVCEILVDINKFHVFIIQVIFLLYTSKNMVFSDIHALFKDVEAKCTYK